MTQVSLFQTSREISLTEELVAVNYKGRWEVYYIVDGWLEMFSHYATPGESLQFYLHCIKGYSKPCGDKAHYSKVKHICPIS